MENNLMDGIIDTFKCIYKFFKFYLIREYIIDNNI